jgi:uncharacterized sulfatase
VLIIGDDHAYTDFGFMGSPVARTPNLDRLAAEGSVFRYGFNTSSVCRPSLLTLLTGLYEMEYQERARWIRVQRGSLEADVDMRSFAALPWLLADAGYTSFRAGKYWHGPYAWGGFAEGMVTFDAEFQVKQEEGTRLVRETVAPVTDFLDRVGERPFFLWFAPLFERRRTMRGPVEDAPAGG